jgi:hypothetical protein
MNHPVQVAFISDSLKHELNALSSGKTEEKMLYANIERALDVLKACPHSGIKIKKTCWPNYYVKRYSITNLWKWDLPNGWRMIYHIRRSENHLLCVLMEWFSHKEYNRRFGYHDS